MNHDIQYLGIDSAMIGRDRKECNLNVYLAPFSYSGEIHPTSINNTVHWGILPWTEARLIACIMHASVKPSLFPL